MPKPSIDGLRLRAKRRLRFGRLRRPGCDDRSGKTHPAPPAFPAPPARIITEVIRPFRGVTPRVHPTAFIDDSAQVIGHVEIGEESGVWMCAVVRGDVHWIRIGRRSNVQDGVIVHAMTGTHPTTVGNSVTIGHGAVIHGCTIEDQCLIGMGSILLNGSHVGAQSIVGAGTVILEDMKIPPRSLVLGAPAKIKRLLTQAEVAGIQTYADRYVEYRLDYLRA
ncbi:MAG: gamma carbonic anhydrase family protein [Acidobacteria bacterium]|nr:MAG: gamma carbonic anhydrase family protein [Acidobacteriota bacterium]